MSALIKERPSADAVLAKAVLAAREQLGLTQLELAGIVGARGTLGQCTYIRKV